MELQEGFFISVLLACEGLVERGLELGFLVEVGLSEGGDLSLEVFDGDTEVFYGGFVFFVLFLLQEKLFLDFGNLGFVFGELDVGFFVDNRVAFEFPDLVKEVVAFLFEV